MRAELAELDEEARIEQVLINAERTLDEKGWCQGKLSSISGQVCAVGAINVGLTGKANPNLSQLDAQFRTKVVNRLGFHDHNHLIGWNDGASGNKAKLLERLRKARGDD